MDNEEELADLYIDCMDCEHGFTWTIGEQKYLKDLLAKGIIKIIVEPRRCRSCKQIKKREQFQREFERPIQPIKTGLEFPEDKEFI